MKSSVVNLARERRRRQGQRPLLALIGTKSDLRSVLEKALGAVDEDDRKVLFNQITQGSYSDLIHELVSQFEIPELEETRAIG